MRVADYTFFIGTPSVNGLKNNWMESTRPADSNHEHFQIDKKDQST